MALANPLIGRDSERALLAERAAGARAGEGAIVLLRGESGTGKTALAREVVAAARLDRADGFARADPAPDVRPLVDVLHAVARLRPACAADAEALAARLEDAPAGAAVRDDGTAVAALLCAASKPAPLAIVFDDMHRAGDQVLAMLPAVARGIAGAGVLVLVAYRDDEVRPDHPLGRLRSELRRDQRLEEVVLGPLGAADCDALLATALGSAPAPALRDAVVAFTAGIPFHVAELAAAGAIGDHRRGPLPIPEPVRDALLARASELPDDARRLLAAAAVAGERFDPTVALAVADADEWPADRIPGGLVAIEDDHRARFRSPLIHTIFSEQVTGPARAALHAAIAEHLAARPGPPTPEIAEHWLHARQLARARRAFLAAADAACSAHVYREGMDAARRVLDLSSGDDAAGAGDDAARADHLAALHRLATCAELAGEPAEAIPVWRELARDRREHRDHPRAAEAFRRLAAALEIEGRWDQAIEARECAAEAFSDAGRPGEAAAERLAAAAHLRSAASFRAARRLLDLAAQDARAAGRADLAIRAQALDGNVRARAGDTEAGVELVRAALAAALDDNLTTVAAEVYQRLADSLEHRGDYAAARATYDDAFAFCTNNGVEPAAQLCLACLSVVLRQAGDWERSAALAADVLDAPAATVHARAAGGCTLGTILALRGDADKARAHLLDALSHARAIELTAAEILSAWGLAMVDQLSDRPAPAADACRAILERWSTSEDRHYGIGPLRWATTLLVEAGDAVTARACAAALAQIAADAGQPEAMSALAHALGEIALLDGDADQAVAHFERAIELLGALGSPPLERIESERRAAVALLQAGRHDEAVERLLTAYHLARRLRMRPAIQRLAAALGDLGEQADRRLSRRQAEQLAHEQLTRRELQVLQHLAAGATNREIAAALVLSVRTVDTHVANVLRKLGCRSRADAARRASELGLLTPAPNR